MEPRRAEQAFTVLIFGHLCTDQLSDVSPTTQVINFRRKSLEGWKKGFYFAQKYHVTCGVLRLPTVTQHITKLFINSLFGSSWICLHVVRIWDVPHVSHQCVEMNGKDIWSALIYIHRFEQNRSLCDIREISLWGTATLLSSPYRPAGLITLQDVFTDWVGWSWKRGSLFVLWAGLWRRLFFSKTSSNDVGFIWMDDYEKLLFLIEPLCKQETLTETKNLLFKSVLVERGCSTINNVTDEPSYTQHSIYGTSTPQVPASRFFNDPLKVLGETVRVLMFWSLDPSFLIDLDL